MILMSLVGHKLKHKVIVLCVGGSKTKTVLYLPYNVKCAV